MTTSWLPSQPLPPAKISETHVEEQQNFLTVPIPRKILNLCC